MRFEQVDQGVRESLTVLRAKAWKGDMPERYFIRRNERLEAHPFAAKRIDTYVLRDTNGTIVSSFDRLRLGLLLAVPGSSVQSIPVGLIASVVTPEEHRENGYASQMLSTHFESRTAENFILYSDIGAPFYERFGFCVFPREEREITPSSRRDFPARSVELLEFAKHVDARRREQLTFVTSPTVVLLPDPQWMDWVRERYRSAAESCGESASEGGYWEVDHEGGPHKLCGFAHFAKGTFDLLWWEQGCVDCLDFARARAAERKVTRLCYWAEPTGDGRAEYPMIKIPGLTPALRDVQLGDWW